MITREPSRSLALDLMFAFASPILSHLCPLAPGTGGQHSTAQHNTAQHTLAPLRLPHPPPRPPLPRPPLRSSPRRHVHVTHARFHPCWSRCHQRCMHTQRSAATTHRGDKELATGGNTCTGGTILNPQPVTSEQQQEPVQPVYPYGYRTSRPLSFFLTSAPLPQFPSICCCVECKWRGGKGTTQPQHPYRRRHLLGTLCTSITLTPLLLMHVQALPSVVAPEHCLVLVRRVYLCACAQHAHGAE